MRQQSVSYRHPFFRLLNLLVICLPVRSKFYANLICMKLDLRPPHMAISAGSHNIHLASENDVEAIRNHPEKAPISFIYTKRLEKGHACYVAKAGEEVLGFLWVNPESFCHFYGSEHPILYRALAKSERFTYDWHVFETHRGKGVLKALVHRMAADLREQGVDAVYSTVEIKNKASINAHLSCGFSPEGLVHLYRVGRFKRVFSGAIEESASLKKWFSEFQKENAGK